MNCFLRYLAFHTNYVQIVSILSTLDSTYQMEEVTGNSSSYYVVSHVNSRRKTHNNV